MDKLFEAIHFATDVFKGKTRKCSGSPAIFHSLEAASIVAGMTLDEDTIAAAVLHDTVEDAGVSSETLREKFGSRVAEIVLAETEDKRRDLPADVSWRVRKQEAIQTLQNSDDEAVKIVFLGDKLANVRSLRNNLAKYGESMWQQFNQADPHEQRWYYRSIAQALSEYSSSPEWQEYDKIIAEIFDEKK